MTNTTHRTIHSLLLAYVEGRLARDEQAAVRAHLAECPTCRNEVEELTGLVSGLQAMPDGLRRMPRPMTRWADIEARLNPVPQPAWQPVPLAAGANGYVGQPHGGALGASAWLLGALALSMLLLVVNLGAEVIDLPIPSIAQPVLALVGTPDASSHAPVETETLADGIIVDAATTPVPVPIATVDPPAERPGNE